MKDFKNYLALGVLSLFLSACTSDNIPDNSGQITFEGDGYLAIDIKLPTQSGTTRANDIYDDGLVQEYDVKDGCLLIFKGTDEMTAEFQAAYQLPSFDGNNEDSGTVNDNITTSYKKAVKVEDISLTDTENLYGLVMLNYQNVATVADKKVTINGADFTGTYSAFINKVLESTKDASTGSEFAEGNFYTKDSNGVKSYFFMSNAPITSRPGGATQVTAGNDNAGVTTLVNLTGKLYESELEAMNKESTSVYVERGVAKVTVSTSDNVKQIGEGETPIAKIQVIDYYLANESKSTFITRNMGTATLGNFPSYMEYAAPAVTVKPYRFVGDTQLGTTTLPPVANLFRTYWCIDPEYNKVKTYNDPENPTTTSMGNPTYCFENTFNVQNQTYQNTTRVVLKATLTKNDSDEAVTFYTVNNDEYNLYTKLEDAQSFAINRILNNASIVTIINNALKPGQSVSIAEWVNVEFGKKDSNGHIKVESVSFKENVPTGEGAPFKSQPVFADEAQKNSIINDANAAYVIAEYTNGESYYDLRVKHFGDDLTPWSAGENENVTTVAATYGTGETAERSYLGRYGMVRNNWYDLRVNKILKLGTPVPPDANTETPDDNQSKQKWVAFTVNVLSWAKRTHDYEIK